MRGGSHVPISSLSPGEFVVISFPLLAKKYSAEHLANLSRFFEFPSGSEICDSSGWRWEVVCVHVCLHLVFAYDFLYLFNLILLPP